MSQVASYTVADLARRLGGSVEGDETRTVCAVETLEQAGPDALSWVGSPDLLPRAAKSNAGVLLTPRQGSLLGERTIIRVDDPDVAVCEVLKLLAPPMEAVPPGVHARATVAEDAVVDGSAIGPHVSVGRRAVVGTGSQLHPGVHVGSDTVIGCDCVLWPNVVIRERVSIGDRVVIHPNTTIGADGFSYLQRNGRNLKVPQIGTVVIEDDVEIGANCAIDRARSGATRIGRGTKIDNTVQIGHNVVIGEHCVIVSGVALAGSASLGHHVVVAGHAGVADHVHVGNHVRIAAKSAVMKDVADGMDVRGVPATEQRRSLREQAWVRKLPESMERLRSLSKRVDELERAASEPRR